MTQNGLSTQKPPETRTGLEATRLYGDYNRHFTNLLYHIEHFQYLLPPLTRTGLDTIELYGEYNR